MSEHYILTHETTIKCSVYCFQGHMSATPDIFAHLTHLLMNLADGKVCAVLEVSAHSSLAYTNVSSLS